jgi:hypothetical protein
MVKKKGVLESIENFKHRILERRRRGAIGTCNKKPEILF